MTALEQPQAIPEGTPIIGEPSFAEAIAAIGNATDLSPANKSHWPTSLRQMARYLDRPLVTIPARITAISGPVAKLHPEQLGIHAKTFANHRANAKSALLWFNKQCPGGSRKAPMAPEYRSLWDQVDNRYARDMLSPFFRFLSGLDIEPERVSDDHVAAYSTYRKETSFGQVPSGHRRMLVRHWNNYIDKVPGWPDVRLSEPPYAQRFTGPGWEDFPEGLRRDIDAYCARISKHHKTANGRNARPCSQSTVSTRRRELIAAVRTGVEVGLPLADLESLRALLHPDRVETIIEHYWQRNGERPTLYTINLASRFLALARMEADFKPEHLERLDEICMCLDEYRSSGLTLKNRTLIRHVIQSDVWHKVIQLPARQMAEARSCRQTMPIKAAVTAQLAVAIRILIMAPIRMQNLASIRLDTNLVRPRGPQTPFTLVFPDYDVKNRVDLEFELDANTSALIEEYVHDHRPHLMRGRNHDYLFPGKERDMKGIQTLSEQISKRLWKILGLKVTPHQFRHAAAAIILVEDAGNYELVRRVLGHRNIQTTINFYIGLETLSATRRFGEIIAAMDAPHHSGAM